MLTFFRYIYLKCVQLKKCGDYCNSCHICPLYNLEII